MSGRDLIRIMSRHHSTPPSETWLSRDSVDKLAAELPSEATGEWHSETASPGSNRQRAAPASASAEAERASFLAALDCYASGGNLDVEEFYELAQRYLKIGVSNDPDDQMHRVLRCIPGERFHL